MVFENLKSLHHCMKGICQRAGKVSEDIVLVGVTKFAEAEAVQEAIDVGLLHIAENRVQLALAKFSQLRAEGVMKHLIGHLQSNKVRDAVEVFDLIQSVDSLKLAQEIEKRASAINKVQDILIQVDIAKEDQKFGLPEEDLKDLLAVIKDLKHVRVLGLMTIAPLTEDENVIRDIFRRCYELFEELTMEYPVCSGDTYLGTCPQNIEMKYLSMGMSADFRIAIEEGANMVRIGSAIFK